MTSAPPADPSAYPAADPARQSGPAPEPAAVPDPPQGPGVHPPFPAPPIEGRGRRVGIGLGIGAAVVLLVCGGGVAGIVGLVAAGTKAAQEHAAAAVDHYFDALEAKKFDEAYGMQCASEREKQTQAEFVSAEETATPIQAHTIGAVSELDLTVDVDLTYTDGQTGSVQVSLERSSSTAGQLEVCGVKE